MLDATLNLRYLPSQHVERQVHPEVEFQDNPKLLLAPILIARNDQEKCLIEASVNTVRISVAVKKGMDIEWLLVEQIERFMALRADRFDVLRKKPAHEGFDFSFLISEGHLVKYVKEEVINFILEFITGIDPEVNQSKLDITRTARFAAEFFNAAASNAIKLDMPTVESEK